MTGEKKPPKEVTQPVEGELLSVTQRKARARKRRAAERAARAKEDARRKARENKVSTFS